FQSHQRQALVAGGLDFAGIDEGKGGLAHDDLRCLYLQNTVLTSPTSLTSSRTACGARSAATARGERSVIREAAMPNRIASARGAPVSNCSSVPAASESPAPVTLTIPVIAGGVIVNVVSGENAANASPPFVTTAPDRPGPFRRAGHRSACDACRPTRAEASAAFMKR